MKLTLDYKKIKDTIHGFIEISNIACKIIDTVAFQRLRYMKQLGLCYLVYPNATHTRFEHSLGTYHITGLLLKSIINNSNNDHINDILNNTKLLEYHIKDVKGYKMDNYVCELIKIAGLCHDLGHGPFSHAFDDMFINGKELNSKHEDRSTNILRYIIESDEELLEFIKPDGIKFISELINPKNDNNGFLYQIISNNINGIDVDKIDYLCRDTNNLGFSVGFDCPSILYGVTVINDTICFADTMYNSVITIYYTRYKLFRDIYKHPYSIAVHMIISDIMKIIDNIIGISESINDVEKFIRFTDDYVICMIINMYYNMDKYEENEKILIKRAYNIYNNMLLRNVYSCIESFVSYKSIENIKEMINDIDKDINVDNIKIHKCKVGFVSHTGDDPMNKLYFYSRRNKNVIITMPKYKSNIVLPEKYNEYLYLYYVTDREDTITINKLKDVINVVKERYDIK